MAAGKLFVSYWEIGLENLPEGRFVHRRITAADAKRAITGARREKRLVCVAGKDILAPYRKHERKNHEALSGVLTQQFGIPLTLRDFVSTFKDDDGHDRYSLKPLVCVKVQSPDRLLVITCCYTLAKRTKRDPSPFTIAPDTVEFHLFESAGKARRAKPRLKAGAGL
jgi:hypothetical protein